MGTEKTETEQELMERFDKEVRGALFEQSNEYRKKKGLPLITEEDFSSVDTLSRLKAGFDSNEEGSDHEVEVRK